jgi:hypothetical protein
MKYLLHMFLCVDGCVFRILGMVLDWFQCHHLVIVIGVGSMLELWYGVFLFWYFGIFGIFVLGEAGRLSPF